VPAILAEGEALNSNGSDLVTAYVAGYEVWTELWRRDQDYHRKGWHPTSVFGVMAAAAAAAVLRKMTPERASTALAIAASHAGGLGSNFGTMVKPYHAGMAARNGVLAARLAAGGMSAGADAIEHPQGYLSAYSTENSPDRDSAVNLGKDWKLVTHSLLVKRYPCCYFMHRSFESTAKMLKGRNIRPDEIESIEVRMGKGQTTVLCNERPKTGLEAKFSEQFAMAAAVILGRMGVPEFTDEIVQRADIQSIFPKVKLISVDEHDPRDPVYSPTERVQIKLKNGEMLDTGPVATIKGHANDPLSTEELWGKFSECTEKTHKPEEAKKLFDLLQNVDKLKSARELPTCTSIFKS
jgi:2-methylcitrate dehydratase PrpD